MQIPLRDGTYAYGQVLKNPLMGFFAARRAVPAALEVASDGEYAFVVWVHKSAVCEGHWPVVGRMTPKREILPRFLHLDVISNEVSFYRDGRRLEGRVTSVDIERHEPAAVWEREHIEERLLDFFAARPNQHLQCIRDRMNRALALDDARLDRSARRLFNCEK